HKGVNPDEVVAVGAAIQGGVLRGEVHDVVLLDVTPLSLGVETQGGIATAIIPRNTTIPTSKSEIFSTTEDAQTVVRIHVVQGEREMAANNKTLGRFELIGIPPAPRGVPQIEVTFDIDADGVVKVSAKDLGTGKSQQIEVTASSGLSETEVNRLVVEAQQYAQADHDRREVVDLCNTADGLIYSTEKTIQEFAEHIPAEERRSLQAAIATTREAMRGGEKAALRSAVDELSALTYKMTENLYAELEGGGSQ
ncbi:MAG: Hsp70 family protein, partial [Candidatus Rokuibacteriota bacterium]